MAPGNQIKQCASRLVKVYIVSDAPEGSGKGTEGMMRHSPLGPPVKVPELEALSDPLPATSSSLVLE